MGQIKKNKLLAAMVGIAGLGTAHSFVTEPDRHLLGQAQAQELALPDPAALAMADEVGNEDFDELTAGPVHEGYSAPVSDPNGQRQVVTRQPPAAIAEESPPRELAADNAVWLSGYWGWDPMQDDFVWVSGLWRIAPPGRVWIPGYWTETDNGKGFVWISGFWTRIGQRELVYLPCPPDSLEQGPNSKQPSANHFWMPGHWVYQANGYVWQPGHWSHVRADWVWAPAQYFWTPAGCIFEPAYWDFTMPRRGILFAPVHFRRPIYLAIDFSHRPQVVINTVQLGYYLYSQPSCNHYYFGDYHGDQYTQVGIYPWYSITHHHHGYYDPFHSYYNWYFGRHNHHWRERFDSHYKCYDDGKLRLPKSYAQQRAMARQGRNVRGTMAVATSLARYSREANWKLQSVSRGRQGHHRDWTQEMRDFQNERRRKETHRTAEGVRPQLARAGQVAVATDVKPAEHTAKPKPTSLKLPNKAYARYQEFGRAFRQQADETPPEAITRGKTSNLGRDLAALRRQQQQDLPTQRPESLNHRPAIGPSPEQVAQGADSKREELAHGTPGAVNRSRGRSRDLTFEMMQQRARKHIQFGSNQPMSDNTGPVGSGPGNSNGMAGGRKSNRERGMDRNRGDRVTTAPDPLAARVAQPGDNMGSRPGNADGSHTHNFGGNHFGGGNDHVLPPFSDPHRNSAAPRGHEPSAFPQDQPGDGGGHRRDAGSSLNPGQNRAADHRSGRSRG